MSRILLLFFQKPTREEVYGHVDYRNIPAATQLPRITCNLLASSGFARFGRVAIGGAPSDTLVSDGTMAHRPKFKGEVEKRLAYRIST